MDYILLPFEDVRTDGAKSGYCQNDRWHSSASHFLSFFSVYLLLLKPLYHTRSVLCNVLLLFFGLITTVSYWSASSDQEPMIIMLYTSSRDTSDWIAVRYNFVDRRLLVVTVLNINALLSAIYPNCSSLARLPRNSAMARCRNADTTWKSLSASGIQPTKKSTTKTNKKQNIKPHNPLWYERSGSDIVSKLRKWKPTESVNRSAEHVHKVALTMISHRRNSTKPLEKAERILHLVRTGFDSRTSRT